MEVSPRVLDKLDIYFGDTSGFIFAIPPLSADETNNALELGSCMIKEDRILIYDRYPKDDISRIYIDDLPSLLRRLLINEKIYNIEIIKKINIYLPKMTRSLFKEAELQRKLQDMILNVTFIEKNKCNIILI
jgi:DNA-dependent RNA polymerase auxiliary subunit epsilon